MGGWEGAQISIQIRLEQEKVARLSPYHTTRPRRRLANDGNSSRSWLAQLAPCVGAILLPVTSQGRQNGLSEKQTRSHWTVETLYMDIVIDTLVQ